MYRLRYALVTLGITLLFVSIGWCVPPHPSTSRGRGTDMSGVPEIETVSPGTIRPGSEIIVRGSGFGRKRGALGLRIEGLRISLPIRSWRDDTVRGTVPAVLEPMCSSTVPATLFVEGPGGTRARSIEIHPRHGEALPAIVAAPGVIRPRESIVVAGRGFGTRKGSVTFAYGSRTCRASILRWKDDHVKLRLPNNLGGLASLRPVTVEMSLEPRGGPRLRKQMAFLPHRDAYFLLERGVVSNPVDLPRRKTHKHCDHALEGHWRVVGAAVHPTSLPEGHSMSVHVPNENSRETVTVLNFRLGASSGPFVYYVGVALQGAKGTSPDLDDPPAPWEERRGR